MRPNIPYIEDHPDNMTLVRIFRPDGYNLMEAGSGLQGVSIADEQDIDLILLDINPPDIDGHEVVRCLPTSRKAHLAKTPIIAIPANAMKGYANKLIDAGCNVYISKPISIQNLMDTVEHLLTQRGMRN